MMIANDKCQKIRDALHDCGFRFAALIKSSHLGNKFKLCIFCFKSLL